MIASRPSRSTRSGVWRWTRCRRRTPGIPAPRWRSRPLAYVLYAETMRHAPRAARVAGSRPLRALGRPRLHPPVRRAAPDGLRPHDGRPEGVPPVGVEDARASRVAPHARRQRHHRPARPGRRQRGRHGDRRADARRALQPAGPRDRRPPHVRDLLRRRHDGGHLGRGVVDRRLPRPRQAVPVLRPQQDHDRGLDRPDVRRGRRRRATRPTAGTSSASRTAGRSTRCATRSRRPTPRPDRPSFIQLRTHIAWGAPHARRHREGARRAARRRGDPADEAGLRLGSRQDVLRPRRRLRGDGPARARRRGAPRLARAPRRLPRGLPRARGRARSRAARAPARRLGVGPARPLRRRLAGDARELGRVHQRAREDDPRARRRLGRPRRLDEHADRRRRLDRRTTRSRAATSTSASASTRWARS